VSYPYADAAPHNKRAMAEQRRNRGPLSSREHLLSKRLGSIVRTFE